MMSKDTKHRVTKTFVREQVHRLLREKLLGGHFTPGLRLTEEFLAGELGVSRTPIREALHKLESEGLVEPAGARGYCVPEDSADDVRELFEIRALLEGYAFGLISSLPDKEILPELEKLVEQAEADATKGNFEEVYNWNTRFHDLLYQTIGQVKPRLYRMLEGVRKHTLRYRKDTLSSREAVQRSLLGHKKILSALELGDPGLSEQVMRHHIYEAMEDMFESPARSGGKNSAKAPTSEEKAAKNLLG